LEAIKILDIGQGAVNSVKVAGERIIVVDSSYVVKIFDKETLDLIGGFKINVPANKSVDNSVDISNTGKYIAIGLKGKHKTSVWDLENKKLLYTLGWHKGDVLSVAFDKEDKYLITGGEDGRSYIWSMQTGKMVTALPPHADYITSTAFSLNGLWAATGSYDKSVTITNISSMEVSYRKRVHKSAVVVLKFLQHQKLLSADKMGELVLWNYPKGQVFKRLAGMVDRVLDAITDKEGKYLFTIALNYRKINLYMLESGELVSDEFIKMIKMPRSLAYINDKHYLLVGTFDGKLYVYDLFADEKKLKKMIEINDFEGAYKLIEKNPFVKNTKAYEALEEKWEKILSLAKRKFEKGEINVARQLLAQFLKIPAKRVIVQSLFNDFSEFEKFKKAVNSAKYPLAYSLAAKYPQLKETVYYKKMEDEWNKLFNIAKKLIFQKGKKDEVRELLKPFRGVSEKTPFIQMLFNDKDLYLDYMQKLKERKFKEFFDLTNRFAFLTYSSEYKKAVEFGNTLLEKAKELLKKGEYEKVMGIINMLEQFPMYEEETQALKYNAEVLWKFNKALAYGEMDKVEELVKEYPFLEDVLGYEQIQQEWRDKLSEAEIFAASGDVEGVLNTLKDYIDVKDKVMKIAQVLKSAYLHQIIALLGNAIKGKKVDKFFEKAVRNYIKLFGFDMEISDLIQKAKKLKMEFNLDNLIEGDLTKWKKYKLPLKIWEDF